MDKCNECRDIILTDYIDAELDSETKKRLEDHLLDCATCRALLKEAQAAALPLETAEHRQVPDHLWSAIKQKIESEESFPQRVKNSIDRWFESLSFPSLVPALSTLALIILVSTSYFQNTQIKQVREAEQGKYLASLVESPDNSQEPDNMALETSIEEYFL